jgi:hypothetical protein
MKITVTVTTQEVLAFATPVIQKLFPSSDVTVVVSDAPGPAIPAPVVIPPAPVDPVPSVTPAVGFTANGEDALIRGNFVLSLAQFNKVAVGGFSKYLKYGEAIIENSLKYSMNPLFILADFANQGVNPAYNNPWGISVDNYPHGPNGSQLGEANGTVRNGPRKFSETEWRIAFDRQFSVVASLTGMYGKAQTIKEWALIDAPPGAENDVHGTNADEGKEVGNLYNGLVNKLNA